jgi:hypothetical protein
MQIGWATKESKFLSHVRILSIHITFEVSGDFPYRCPKMISHSIPLVHRFTIALDSDLDKRFFLATDLQMSLICDILSDCVGVRIRIRDSTRISVGRGIRNRIGLYILGIILMANVVII